MEIKLMTMKHQEIYEISIIMPCLNEAETISICIQKALRFLDEAEITGEIVIGDNGSIDGSQELALAAGARVVDVKTRGYGAAIHGSVINSYSKYCIVGDADDSYDFSNLYGFVEQLRSGVDLVMGNRFLGGIKKGAMPWKNRYIGNPVLSGIGKLLFRAPVHDFHCGLRGFSRQAFIKMDLHTTGMELASEMVIKAAILGLNIVEIPTILSKDGRSRPPHLRPFRDGWRHLRLMLLFSPDWLFLYPGTLLMGMGLMISCVLMLSAIEINGVHFNVGSLIYCVTMFEVGFQAFIFGVLTRTYAVQEGLFPARLINNKLAALIGNNKGLIIGSSLLMVGVSLMGYSFYIWHRNLFGELDYNIILRIIIGSSLFISIGAEVLLSTFMLSILRLSIRARDKEQAMI
jgi:glycosyltransferase involved in cell wall biosynthesis